MLVSNTGVKLYIHIYIYCSYTVKEGKLSEISLEFINIAQTTEETSSLEDILVYLYNKIAKDVRYFI